VTWKDLLFETAAPPATGGGAGNRLGQIRAGSVDFTRTQVSSARAFWNARHRAAASVKKV